MSHPATPWLRLEGAGVLAAGLVAAWALGVPFWIGLAVFILPDAGFAAYLAGPRLGAVGYNLAHSHLGPLVLAGAVWLAGGAPVWLGLAAVWAAHIGMDRMLGYGLKGTTFQDTHLGRIGRRRDG